MKIRIKASSRSYPDRKSLAESKPDLVPEWHPTLNGALSPQEVLPNSNKKMWWKCRKGHEWQASPNARFIGSNCPFCAGKRVSPENSLAVNAPQISLEWHPTKNGELKPSNVTKHSNKHAWWICEKGHEWKTSINNRSNGKGCPFCAGNKVAPDTCLLITHPEVSRDWHPTLNETLTTEIVSKGSHQKVWWKCIRGHEWQASINNRSKGRNCPFCSPKTSTVELQLYAELKYLFPNAENRYLVNGIEADIYIPDFKIAVEFDGALWHSEKYEQDKKKNDAFYKLNVMLIRIRDEGLQPISSCDILCRREQLYGDVIHFSVIKSAVCQIINSGRLDSIASNHLKTYISGGKLKNTKLYKKLKEILPSPPEEKSLAMLNPSLASTWHPTKNDRLTSYEVSPFTNHKAWWLCSQGHEWQASIYNRHQGNGCPICANRKFDARWHASLADKHPLIAAQWHPDKNFNKTVKTIPPNYGKNVWWLCQYGHEWQATPNNRVRGSGCPYCSGKLASLSNSVAAKHSDLVKEWHPLKNDKTRPDTVTPGSGKNIWWVCGKGHEWQATVANRVKGSGCPYCIGRRATVENSLATLRPDIAAQWHDEGNDNITAAQVTLGSNKKVWWVCSSGHEWLAMVYKRVNGSGCPECYRLSRKIRKK